jgi:hypothetical protein
MSDDLVERLRDDSGDWLTDLAADRIEELEAELHLMKTAGIIEVSVRNASVMEYMKHWEGRAETAEAKLAKAVEALAWCSIYENSERATSTLAELKGEK